MLSTKSAEFKNKNYCTFQIAEQIEKVLKFNGLSSIVTVVNTMSLCLKLPPQLKQRNSTLCISNKGGGKSTLLVHILAKSNPKFFTILPKKMFESELIDQDKSYFHNKVLVHDDIISALGGTNKKQREQLVSFFTLLLSDGHYSRQGKILDGVNCMAHFGIAMSSFVKHRRDLMDSTFLDRFATFRTRLNHQQKMEVLQHRDFMLDNNVLLPKIKLPLTKSKKEVKVVFNEQDKNKLRQLAMELDLYNVLSYTRAYNYIRIFIMSNALLNNRTVADKYDLELYEVIHQYHLESSYEMTKKHRIIATIRSDTKLKPEEICELAGVSKATFYRIMKQIRVTHPELSRIIT